MNIVLTGATGYLGSHLVEAFLDKEYSVVILKRSFSKTYRIEKFLEKVDIIDIDKEPLKKAFELKKIDAVIHTATCYGRHQETTVDIFKANTLFALELLETAINFNTDTFFNTDTILYEYLNQYALSKKQFTDWGKLLAIQDKIAFLNIRLEHMYGPKDDTSKFVGAIVKQCLSNQEAIALTQGTQKRDFIYITDVVNAYLLLLKNKSKLKKYQEVGLGSGEPVTIRFLVEFIHKLCESKSILDFGRLPMRQNEHESSKADLSYLESLGWTPRFSLKQGLIDMINKEKII